MQLTKSQRSKAKIKMALQGPSGSGKTMSALLLAQGLTNGDLSKVAVICTENGSANLYAHLGGYSVLNLEIPHSPQRYIEAIDVCINSGIEVVIIDSTSHCWDFLIDYHASLPGNSFTNWSKITPMQKAFLDKKLAESKNESWAGKARKMYEIDNLQVISTTCDKAELERVIRATYTPEFPPEIHLHGYKFVLKL